MQVRRLANSLVVRVLVIGVLITVFGTFVRFSLLSETMRDNIEANVSAHLLSDATYVARDIDEKIRLRQNFLETLARQLPPALLGKPAALEAWLAERHALAPHFSLGIVVLPLDGHGAIADFPVVAGRRQFDFSATPWFQEVRNGASFAIGKPVVGRLSNQGLIAMAVPLRDARGELLAVLSAATTLDAPGFLNLIQNNTIGKSGGFLLVSPKEQIFVAASEAALRLQPIPPPGTNALHDRAMAGWRGAGMTVNAKGVEELVGVASLHATDWFVVARMPSAEAFSSVDEARRLLLRKGLGIGLVVLLLFAAVLVRLFRPLREASRRIHQMAYGQVPLSPLARVRHDEVGEMVDGFNYLVAQVREKELRMTELAHHDTLTSLPNRLSFLKRAQQTVALARRQESRLALMFIDLDGFKPINDRHGHEAGDLLLQQVALRLGEGFRQADMVARFGGDEFVVLLSDVRDRDSLSRLADKVIARLSAPYQIDGVRYTIGASIGIACLPDDAEDIESLIAQADAAMYDAKRAGRNCCRFAHRAL